MEDPAQILQTGTSVSEEGEKRNVKNGSVQLEEKQVLKSEHDNNIELLPNGYFLHEIEESEKCAIDVQDGGTRDVLSVNNMAGYSVVSLAGCESFLPADYAFDRIGSDFTQDTSTVSDVKKVDEWLKGVKQSSYQLLEDSTYNDEDPDDPERVAGMESLGESNQKPVTEAEGNEDYLELVIKTQAGEQVYRIKSNITLDALQPLTMQQVLSLQVVGNGTQQDSADKTDDLVNSFSVAKETTGDDEASSNTEDASEISIAKPVDNNMLYRSCYDTLGRNKNKSFPCPVDDCSQVFNKECKLKIHLMSHEDARPFKCKLEGCDWAFSSFYRLKRHLLTHIGRKDFVCDEPGCNSRFTTVYNLNSHKELHRRQNTFSCRMPGCDKKFPTQRRMELHLKDHSDMEAPYKCPLASCGKSYYSANFLASHLRVHQYGKDDLKCPFPNCGKCFLRLCQLKQHLRQHTGERPYSCDYPGCGWNFSSASKLTRHTRKHTGDRRYVCPEAGCGKSFMRPEHLKGHVVIHTGVRPFQCPHPNCQISFTAKSSLYVHLKKHRGEPQKLVFACPLASCMKKYSCKASLRQHFLKAHATDLAQADAQGITLGSCQETEEIGTLEDLVQEATGIPVSVISNGDSTVELPETTVIDSSELLLQQSALTSQLLTNTGTVSGDLLTQQLAAMSTAQLIMTPDLLLPSLNGDGISLENAQIGTVLSRDLDLLTKALPGSTGGSARTDYCSNLILSSRAKRRRLLQQQFKIKDAACIEPSRTLGTRESSLMPDNGILSSADVVLSSAIALPEPSIANQFAHSQLLQDDPPTSDIDHLLNTELPVPLLVESSVSTSVSEFAGSTINLQDLE